MSSWRNRQECAGVWGRFLPSKNKRHKNWGVCFEYRQPSFHDCSETVPVGEEFRSWLCSLPTLWPWTSDLACLCFSLLVCNMVVKRIKGDQLWEALRMCWAQSEYPLYTSCCCWFAVQNELCHANIQDGYYPQLNWKFSLHFEPLRNVCRSTVTFHLVLLSLPSWSLRIHFILMHLFF